LAFDMGAFDMVSLSGREGFREVGEAR
jgi:hypothetical protein